MKNEKLIAIIGLGYVGLPLAVEFGKIRKVIGYDINATRVSELSEGFDRTNECSKKNILSSKYLKFTSDELDINSAKIFIVTVPTPVDKNKHPDLKPLQQASKTIGKFLKKDSIVIYESTVFPGATEEICVPILEEFSQLKFNSDFYCGYSPERINPGDKKRRLTSIKKITSGSTIEVALEIDKLYSSIIRAGTHRVSSIKVAEAAKIIENTQRDLNIALINELSIIFHKLDIDTLEVLEAAGTKWNFLPFKPGLVGGHCIGVDPYYLTHKSQEVGYHPEVILSGRRINDSMSRYVADLTIKLMIKKGHSLQNSKILIMGLSFKENCPDIRNSKIPDIVKEFQSYNLIADIYDPIIDIEEADREYRLKCLTHLPSKGLYSAIVIAVGHYQFLELGELGIKALGINDAVLFDVKGILPLGAADGRL